MTQANFTKTFFKGLYGPPEYNDKMIPAEIPKFAGIYENIETQEIFLPIAGYTKSVSYYPGAESQRIDNLMKSYSGQDRQGIIYFIWRYITSIQQVHHSQGIRSLPGQIAVELIDEPQNPFDKEAMAVLCSSSAMVNPFQSPVGYIPRSINKIVREHREWLELDKAQMIIHHGLEHKSLYIPQLVIPYKVPSNLFNRFLNIEYD